MYRNLSSCPKSDFSHLRQHSYFTTEIAEFISSHLITEGKIYASLMLACSTQLLSIPRKGENAHLPVGELNPGLPRDRRGYSPLY